MAQALVPARLLKERAGDLGGQDQGERGEKSLDLLQQR
jgi:hypothetical protein